LASLLCLGAWVGFSFLPEHPGLIYLFALVANTGFAITDVVTDALIVENSTESNTRSYQSLAWGFRSFGAVLGGVTGGWLAQYVPYQWVFGLTALLPLTTLFAVVSIPEAPHHPKREETAFLWTPIFEGLRALFQGDFKWFSGYILVGSFSASFSTPFFFFLKEKLTFSESFLGTLSSLTWLGAIAGCFLYGKLFGKLSLKTGLRIAVWLNTLNILSTYLVVNHSSATLLSLLGGVLAYLSLLPLMGAAALLSRQKGMEGSLFALLMSVNNLGQIVSAFMGAKLFAIIGLKLLIFYSALIGLCGLFFVGRLKKLG
jgi:MFS family permease